MKIVTDSGMDTAPGQLDGFDVVQVPLKLELDGKTYLSGVDIQPEEFYELLLTTSSLPITFSECLVLRRKARGRSLTPNVVQPPISFERNTKKAAPSRHRLAQR